MWLDSRRRGAKGDADCNERVVVARQVVRPPGPGRRATAASRSLAFASSDTTVKRPTNMGVYTDAVLLDHGELLWLNPLPMKLVDRKTGSDGLRDFDMKEFRTQFPRAVVCKLWTRSHARSGMQGRHGTRWREGATEDPSTLASLSSVSRYERPCCSHLQRPHKRPCGSAGGGCAASSPGPRRRRRRPATARAGSRASDVARRVAGLGVRHWRPRTAIAPWPPLAGRWRACCAKATQRVSCHRRRH